MKKTRLLMIVTTFLVLCPLLLAFGYAPTTVAQQTDPTLEQPIPTAIPQAIRLNDETTAAPEAGQVTAYDAWTGDGNWTLKTTFNPGDPIQYVIGVENTTGADADIELTYQVWGPDDELIYDFTYELTTSPGVVAWSILLNVPFGLGGTHQLIGYVNQATLASTTYFVTGPTSVTDLSLSASAAGSVGGVSFQPGDILFYYPYFDNWFLLFDASDVGVTKNISSHAFEETCCELLLSFSANQALAGLGTLTSWDVVNFNATSLGDPTEGSFEWYFDGSDVGLTKSGEKIDALDIAPDGRLLISTTGTASVPGPNGVIKAQDEDVLAFNPTSLGQNTTGTWSLYFNGTAIPGLAACRKSKG